MGEHNEDIRLMSSYMRGNNLPVPSFDPSDGPERELQLLHPYTQCSDIWLDVLKLVFVYSKYFGGIDRAGKIYDGLWIGAVKSRCGTSHWTTYGW